MAQPTYAIPQTIQTTSIISPLFCSPSPIDLAIVNNIFTISGSKFTVTDVNGNVLFRVKKSYLPFQRELVIFDAAENPVVTLRKKTFTAHRRWEVFRGESSDSRDLIFSAKLSSLFQFKTKLDVFLAHNTSENVWDFKVKQNWFEKSCIVYSGESSAVVAHMQKKTSARSIFLGKNKLMVTVYPNMDYAFIVALIVILDEINSARRRSSSSSAAN